MTADIVIRPAVESETERIAEIIFKEPPRESVWMLGSKRKATALGKAMVAMDGEMNWRNTRVAEMSGRVVGVMQRGLGQDGGVNVGPLLIWHTLRIVGPFGVPKLMQRMKVRERLNFTRPEGSYHISEFMWTSP